VGPDVTLVLDGNIMLYDIGVNISEKGTLIMNNGAKISGVQPLFGTTDTVFAVSVDSGGTFTMNGGEISGNYGGVRVSGTFTMNGGKISGNYDVGVSGDTFIMKGGEISDNRGGVSADTFTMYGGEISGNNGGVIVYTFFTKTGGTIFGYTNGDSKSNVVKGSSGAVLQNQGHAVYVTVEPYHSRGRDSTSGPADNLSCDKRTFPFVWSGEWEDYYY
jgi:hypothetical protein